MHVSCALHVSSCKTPASQGPQLHSPQNWVQSCNFQFFQQHPDSGGQTFNWGLDPSPESWLGIFSTSFHRFFHFGTRNLFCPNQKKPEGANGEYATNPCCCVAKWWINSRKPHQWKPSKNVYLCKAWRQKQTNKQNKDTSNFGRLTKTLEVLPCGKEQWCPCFDPTMHATRLSW